MITGAPCPFFKNRGVLLVLYRRPILQKKYQNGLILNTKMLFLHRDRKIMKVATASMPRMPTKIKSIILKTTKAIASTANFLRQEGQTCIAGRKENTSHKNAWASAKYLLERFLPPRQVLGTPRRKVFHHRTKPFLWILDKVSKHGSDDPRKHSRRSKMIFTFQLYAWRVPRIYFALPM